jgi:hypothetical protein
MSFQILYDLRDADVWQQANEHRRLWGRRFTDCHVLDRNHLLLSFHSGGERWHAWEERRKKLLLTERVA